MGTWPTTAGGRRLKLKGSCQEANSELELSQLLFISIRQRELARVLALLVCLLIHNLLGLCASYPTLPTKLCVMCLVT